MRHVQGFLAILSVGLLLVGTVVSCRHAPQSKSNGVSGATPAHPPEPEVLPPRSDDYEVLGRIPVLGKRFVVKYDNNLYRGGQPCTANEELTLAELRRLGIKTIISISPDDNQREFCRKHGFTLVEIPFVQAKGPSTEDLKRFLDTFKTAEGPIYLHCVGGTQRAGVLGVAYRVHVLNWPYEKALIEYGRLGGEIMSGHVALEAVRAYRP